MWILALYLVYKKNPEIMNTESLHSTLSGPQKQMDARALNATIRDNQFTELANLAPSRLSHRYVSADTESFQKIELSSNSIQWTANDNFLLVKESAKVTVAKISGEILWTFSLPGENVFTPGHAPQLGSTLYLTTTSGRIYAFDVTSGQIIWYVQSPLKFFRSPLINKSELLLFAEQESNQYWTLQVLDAQTGAFKKTFSKLELPLSGKPIATGEFVYFATQSGQLSALNLDDGKIAWTTEASSSFHSSPSAIGERIYLTNEDGLALGFDRNNGKKISEIELGASIEEPLKRAEGTNIAITIDTSGNLMAADLSLGKRIWRYNLNMQGTKHHFGLYKLTNKALSQLNFNSTLFGWTVWTACNSTKLCIFDLKDGRLLHRIELRAEPLAQPEFVGADDLLLIPVKNGSGAKIIGFQIPADKTSVSAPITEAPSKPAVDK